MTIDEMIKELEDQASYHDVCLSAPRSIIAALKAGQNLSIEARNFVELAECDGDDDLLNALVVWDAATREEV
jgi:hypothetical protein